MVLPKSVARANKRGLNKVTRHLVPHLPGFALLHHVGRRSGKAFETPINIFRTGPGQWRIALTYGPDTDWLRNVRAAGRCEITYRGKRFTLVDPVLVTDPHATGLPAPVRTILSALHVDQHVDLHEP